MDSRPYLISTFGKANWVLNLRAAGKVILSHGRRSDEYAAVELPPEEGGPVLKRAFAPYLASPVGRMMLSSWYQVTPNTSPGDFVQVAEQHPVFALRESSPA